MSGRSPYGGKAVKAGMAAFLAGRGASAVLTFIAFALAARLLPLAEYGKYAAALALMELMLALSSGGLEWVAARVLPECRMHAGGRATARLVLRLGALQSVLVLCAASLVLLAAPRLETLLGLPGSAPVLRLAGLLIAVEGLGRLARDQMLGLLMEQRAGQIAQILRAAGLTLQLGLAWHAGAALDAAGVMGLEVAAAGVALLASYLLLARCLWRLRALPAERPDWTPPPRRVLAGLALHNFASYLLSLLYGPQVLTMLIARLLGADAVAVFGFARAFAEQVRRYLPTDLLQSVVRPALIAYYASGRSFTELSVRLGLWLKSSLMALFPLLVFFSAFGEQGMLAIGGVRYVAAWPVVLLLLCSAATMSCRRVLELGCNTVMQSDICVRATSVLLVVPPLLALLLHQGAGLLAAVALVVAAECVFCWRVVRALKSRGYMGNWDVQGGARLLLAWAATVAVLLLAQRVVAFPVPAAIVAAGLASAVALRMAVPLSAAEGRLVAGFNGRLARLVGSRGALP
ncbi:lipopolysaccharide biosynthesis protein [Pseudoduganella namucuonensis]|uniref:Membrane protein involved in the export of O-antigen and teichoic acid n=1 Tax=Pseudoduganella namucuonensis TaxID=1035707 RepID=A0A1I7I0T3_9BURK|nr:oligosaccharide flippase family protein [Pseudoduganella namucuonensis]SFU66527.1 Membrane protein involved in the export of O-antigen and teichoic acid [Pseudoduganella namucuonensis]